MDSSALTQPLKEIMGLTGDVFVPSEACSSSSGEVACTGPSLLDTSQLPDTPYWNETASEFQKSLDIEIETITRLGCSSNDVNNLVKTYQEMITRLHYPAVAESMIDSSLDPEEQSNPTPTTHLSPETPLDTTFKKVKPREAKSARLTRQKILVQAFEICPKPNKVEMRAIAERCKISPKQARTWFSNRRARNKKKEVNTDTLRNSSHSN